MADASEKPDEKNVKVDYYVPDNMQVLFGDNSSIVFAEDMFYLTFFQVEPPVVFDAEGANEVEAVKSRAIVRMAVTPKNMKSLAEALQRSVKRYEEQYKGGDR